MELNKQDLLEDLGLAQQNHKPYGKKTLHIDKGEIDPKSHGGVAMLSLGDFDAEGFLQALDVKYWAVHPDGRYEVQHLFQMELQRRPFNRVKITSLTVLGREISLSDSRSVDTVIEAIRRIHVNLRDREPELPDVAGIFKDCNIEDIVGESLPLPGFHSKSRLYFPISPNFNFSAAFIAKPELILPLEAVRPLMGIRKNTIDTDHSYVETNRLRVRGVPNPKNRRKFEMVSELLKHKTDTNERHLKISQQELDVPVSGARRKPLLEATWSVIKSKNGNEDSVAKLTGLNVRSQNIMMKGFRGVMGMIGVINRTHADMLKLRNYPSMRDYLAEFGHLETMSSSSAAPSFEGRLVLVSRGGNNLREIYPGIGEDIGGNCKVVRTEWMDRKTKSIRRLGVIMDLGAYIIRKKSKWTGGGPDIVEDLEYCKDIFISHHHLDHLDFIIPYIKRAIIKPHHCLHMTPEVFEMAKDKLSKWGIKLDDARMPKINLLEGAGVLDLKDDDGVLRMSVAYGVDAVPHSAKDTPFIAYGRHGKKILGSYMYLGDMRYDEDWFADHDSPFWDPVSLMLKHDPTLKGQEENLIPTYTEQDGTSVKRHGRGARESEVEDNLVNLINNCLFDKHVLISMIGTNDGRRETGLRIANRTQRKTTAFGAAVEKIFAVANKLGVNPYRCPRPDPDKYTGVKDYLKWNAEQLDIPPTEFSGRTSDTTKEWFETQKPGGILAFLSGSQGTDIEQDSVTYKLSLGTSYFDADPETSPTARPLDMKDCAIIVSQSAIPGNQGKQRQMIERLARRGAIVFEAIGDGFRVHNAGKLEKRITEYLATIGHTPTREANTIAFENFAIHSSGHGRNGDFRLWLHKLKAKFFGVHHTDDMESVHDAYDTILEEGKLHPGGIFENAEEVDIGNDFVRAIGRSHTSVVLTEEIAEEGKHYNKRLNTQRVINFDRSPHDDLGLSGRSGGFAEVSFGQEDIEDIYAANDPSVGQDVRSDNCHAKPQRPFLRPVASVPEWKPLDMKVA